jgi:peptidoglycan/LPS O-acetylase OafA/YrhL
LPDSPDGFLFRDPISPADIHFVTTLAPSPEIARPASPRAGYVAELDTFRLVAILSVMCIHWLNAACLFNRLQGQISNGVHLFFVLSGYLITRILLSSRADIDAGQSTIGWSLRQFYARRFLRIFPVYYLVLVVGVAFHFEGLRAGLFWHASYLSNFYYYKRQLFDGPASLFWTLAVEEQFYILWPLAILVLPRRAILPFVAAVALIGTGCRVQVLLADSWAKILLPACSNFLAVGALGAIVESPFTGSDKLRRNLLRTFAVLIAMLACCSAATVLHLGFHRALDSFVMRAIDQPMMSMVYVCIFTTCARGVPGLPGTLLRFPPLVYLGRISYGLYLYHLFVTATLVRFENHIGHRAAESFAVRFLATVAVASVSWFVFERPLNELKRYFPYRLKKTPAVEQ